MPEHGRGLGEVVHGRGSRWRDVGGALLASGLTRWGVAMSAVLGAWLTVQTIFVAQQTYLEADEMAEVAVTVVSGAGAEHRDPRRGTRPPVDPPEATHETVPGERWR
jgi:hypothetical protein